MPPFVGSAGTEPDSTLHQDGKFQWSQRHEPHKSRRTAILDDHPEIKQLMGPCWKTKWVVLLTVCIQCAMAYNVRNLEWPYVLFFTYVVSGTLNHMMTLAIHEMSHNLGFKTRWMNRILGLVANIPMGIPAAISFKRYHLEHHRYQGEDHVDVDVPTSVEGVLFKSRPGKLLWLLLQPAFYSLRPLITNPKNPGPWEFINIGLIFSTDFLCFYFCGWAGLFYFVFGTLLGMGIHPVAGHFVAEHYVLNPGFETVSYYGPLNWVTFNVGYHNEHHDFPGIPGSRLHKIRTIAPEYYETLPQYGSWSQVLFEYVARCEITPYSRVKRVTMTKQERETIQARELKAHLAS